MSERPNILIIGAGGIVKDAHLPAYKIAGIKVAGIFDIDYQKASGLAKNFQIPKTFSTLKELIASAEDHTVFDLAVPGKEILGVLKQIPDHSVILIQKPMGENLAMARKILEVCRSKNLKAGVNFQLRYAPFITKAKEIIASGKLGDICDIEINVNVFTPWHLWEFLKSVPRMEILYHSIHYIDLVRNLLGEPQKIYAKTIKHPASAELTSVKSNILMDYGDYQRASILTNHNHGYSEKYQRSFIKIEGTKGAVRIEMGVLKAYPGGKEDKFEYIFFDQNPSEWQEMKIDGTWFPHAFIGTIGEMISAIENPDHVPDNSVEDCIKTMACVEAAYISSAEGGVDPGKI